MQIHKQSPLVTHTHKHKLRTLGKKNHEMIMSYQHFSTTVGRLPVIWPVPLMSRVHAANQILTHRNSAFTPLQNAASL